MHSHCLIHRAQRSLIHLLEIGTLRILLLRVHLLLFLTPTLALQEGHRWRLVRALVRRYLIQKCRLISLHLRGRAAEVVIDLHLLQTLAYLLDLGGCLRSVVLTQGNLVLFVLYELCGGWRASHR